MAQVVLQNHILIGKNSRLVGKLRNLLEVRQMYAYCICFWTLHIRFISVNTNFLHYFRSLIKNTKKTHNLNDVLDGSLDQKHILEVK